LQYRQDCQPVKQETGKRKEREGMNDKSLRTWAKRQNIPAYLFTGEQPAFVSGPLCILRENMEKPESIGRIEDKFSFDRAIVKIREWQERLDFSEYALLIPEEAYNYRDIFDAAEKPIIKIEENTITIYAEKDEKAQEPGSVKITIPFYQPFFEKSVMFYYHTFCMIGDKKVNGNKDNLTLWGNKQKANEYWTRDKKIVLAGIVES
jgi:hypothetical protein